MSPSPYRAPGPTGLDALRTLAVLRRDPLAEFQRLRARHGDVVRIPLGHRTFYLLAHPRDVKHVLQDNHRNYLKRTATYGKLRTLVGDGVLTSDREHWRRQRRLIQPVFHREQVGAFSQLIVAVTRAMLERWRDLADRDQPMDIGAEMMRVTLAIVGRALLGIDLSDRASAISRALTVALDHLKYRVETLLDLPPSFPTARNRRFARALQTLDMEVYGIIRNRTRPQGPEARDLLDMLLDAHDEESGEGLDSKQLRDQVMTFILAGHETTANALTWTWYLLSKDPRVASKLRAELQHVLGGREPEFEDLTALRYGRMVIQEALRLYPPVWLVERRAIAEDRVGAYRIPAHATVALCQYVTHRHPEVWDAPEEFRPERFTAQQSATRLRLAYFPFGAGARLCVGEHFAMTETLIILAMVAQAYDLQCVSDGEVTPVAGITLRPEGTVAMTLHRL